jgi:hypothetical protein
MARGRGSRQTSLWTSSRHLLPGRPGDPGPLRRRLQAPASRHHRPSLPGLVAPQRGRLLHPVRPSIFLNKGFIPSPSTPSGFTKHSSHQHAYIGDYPPFKFVCNPTLQPLVINRGSFSFCFRKEHQFLNDSTFTALQIGLHSTVSAITFLNTILTSDQT